MANGDCIVFKLDHSDAAEQLRSWFPGKSDALLGDYLSLWRQYKGKANDDYPLTKEALQKFIDNELGFVYSSKKSMEQIVGAYSRLHKEIGIHISDRVNMIVDDFADMLRDFAKQNGISEASIKADPTKLNEVVAEIIGQYKALSKPENAMAIVEARKKKGLSDEDKQKRADHLAKEYSKMVNNFNLLFEKARFRIEELNNVKFRTDFSKMLEAIDDDIDWEQEDTGVTERYKDDRREEHTIKTLASYTKDVISDIPMRNDDGKIILDDMFRKKKLDIGTVYNVLASIGQDATAETFIQKMRDNEKYASILEPILRKIDYTDEQNAALKSGNVTSSMLMKIRKKDKARTSLISNFLKAKAIYVRIYSDKRDEEGNYDKSNDSTNKVSNLNDASGSDRNAVTSQIRSSMLSGINSIYSEYSIYNEAAVIGRPSEYTDGKNDAAYFRSIISEIGAFIKDFNHSTNEALKEQDARRTNQYREFFINSSQYGFNRNTGRETLVRYADTHGLVDKEKTREEFAKEWIDNNPHRIEQVKNWLGGLGIDANSKVVTNVILSNKTRYAKKEMSTDIVRLLDLVREVYDSAARVVEGGHHMSTDDFLSGSLYGLLGTYGNPRKKINAIGAILGNGIGNDLEGRVLVNGHSYATNVQKDKMHDVFTELKDLLKSERTLSKEEYVARLTEMFGYEGYVTDYNAEEYLGGITGWINGSDPNYGDLDVVDFTDFKNVEYAKMTERQRFVAYYTLMMKDKGYGRPLIPAPQSADRKTQRYISHSIAEANQKLIYDKGTGKAINIKSNERILESYFDEVLCEVTRIKRAYARSENMKTLTEEQKKALPDAGAYRDNDTKFFIFPEFNDKIDGLNVYDEFIRLEADNASEAVDFLIDRIAQALDERIDEAFDLLRSSEINLFELKEFRDWVQPIGATSHDDNGWYTVVDGKIDRSMDERFKNGDYKNVELTKGGRLKLQNFILNFNYGTQQIAKILGNNPAFYSTKADQVKRASGNQAPGVSIDYTARYHGVPVFKSTNDNVLYLADSVRESIHKEHINALLETIKDNGASAAQVKLFENEYNKIVQTDGQGLRTLDSMRAIRIGFGGDEWTDEDEAAYKRIKNRHTGPGEYKHLKEDVRRFSYQHLKPVVTGYEDLILEDGSRIRREVYHKYAEAVLLPSYYYDAMQNGSPYLRGLAIAAEQTGADAFVFASCSKICPTELICDPGEHKKDENGNSSYRFKDAKDIASYIVGVVNARPQAMHKIPLKYYRKTSHTPVHSTDTKRAWSTQALKCATNDAGNEKITVGVGEGSKTMRGKEVKHLISEIEAATAIVNFKKLGEDLRDNDKMEKLLAEEIASKDYNSPEVQSMLKMTKDGQFVVPVFNAVTNRLSQQLVGSIIRRRLSRPMTKGGSAIQESSIGIDNDGIRYDDELEMPDVDKLEMKFDDNGNFQYVEAYVPLLDTKFANILVEGGYSDKNGVVDRKSLDRAIKDGVIDEDVLKFVAYRTPSDGPHSVIPLRIKGFMIGSKGASMILPRESEVMMGHDFDADKLLFHLKQYTIDDELDMDDADIALAILGKNKLQKRIRTVQYDYNKSAIENTQAARDNAMIELVYATLTSPEGAARMLIPGGFELAKRTAKIIEYMKLTKHRNDANVKRINSKKDFDKYMEMSSGKLDRMCNDFRSRDSVYDLAFSLRSTDAVMKGKLLIDRFALYSSALMQLQGSGIKMNKTRIGKDGEPYTDSVGLFGNEIDELFNIYGFDGSYSSLVLSQLLNAVVDNAKDPLAGLVNITENTVDTIAFMAAAGFSIEQILLVMNHPAVIKACDMADENKYGISTALYKLIEQLKNANKGFDEFGKEIGIGTLGYKRMTENITGETGLKEDWFIQQIGKTFEEVTASGGDVVGTRFGAVDEHDDNIKNTIGLLMVVKKIADTATVEFNELVQNIRPESSSASYKQTIGQQVENEMKLDNLVESLDDPEFGLILPPHVIAMFAPADVNEDMSEEELFNAFSGGYDGDRFVGSFSSHVTALNNLMQRMAMDFMSKHFPQARESWRYMLKTVFKTAYAGMKRHGDASLADNIIREAIQYKMSQDGSFAGDVDGLEKNREYYLNELPKSLKKMANKCKEIRNSLGNEEKMKNYSKAEIALAKNIFFEKLYVRKPQVMDDISHIMANIQGTVDSTILENFRNGWAEMLDSKDESIRKMAVDLYVYGFYHNGFGFGMGTFSQLAPLTVMMAASEYVPAMKRILTSDFSDEDVANFTLQYMLNHWYDKRVAKRFSNKNLSMYVKGGKVGEDELHVDKKISEAVNDEFGDITEYSADIKVHAGSLVLAFDAGNKKHLYFVTEPDPNSKEYVFTKVPMLSYQNKHQQIAMTYNPYKHAFDMERYSVGDDPYWGLAKGVDSQSDISAPSEWVASYNIFEASDQSRVKKVTGTSDNKGLMNAIRKAKEAKAKAAAAAKATEVGDTANGSQSTLDAIANMNPFEMNYSNEAPYSASAHVDNMMEADRMNEERNAPSPESAPVDFDAIANMNPFEGGFASLALAADAETSEGHKTYIEFRIPTLQAIYEARQQRAAVALQKWIERTLAAKGVAIGELRDAQAKLNGFFNYATPKTTAEGFKEMILIANNEKGEAALPEEFAHFALACLGRNHPLVVRLLNSLRSNHDALVDAIGGQKAFDAYFEREGGNHEKLVWEAAGKLLAKHLIAREEILVDTPAGGLLRRIIDAIKRFFRQFKADDVRRAIYNADKMAGDIAAGLLEGELVDHLNLENISDSMSFKSSVKDLTMKDDYLSRIVKREVARIKMYKRRTEQLRGAGARSAVMGAAEDILSNLKINLQHNKIDKAIADYMLDIQNFLGKTEERIKQHAKAGNVNLLCKHLNTVKDTIMSFAQSMDDIEAYLGSKDSSNVDAEMRASLLESYKNVRAIVDEFNNYYNTLSQMYFEKSLQDYFGEEVTIPIGKDKYRKISIKELAKYAPNDISFMSRWFNSLADTSDVALKMFDFKVKKARFAARQDTIKLQASIHDAINKLHAATGSYDTSFIYQMKDGKQTGRYKGEVAIINEFGKGSAQHEYWKFFMNQKAAIDALLPKGLVYKKDYTIKVMKSTLEKVKREIANKDAKGVKKDIWNAFTEQLLDTSDDINYEVDEVVKDFSGNRIDMLPVKYTRLSKYASADDVSLDSATALLLYGDMAHNFSQMDSIIGELENARYRAQEREVQVKNGGKNMLETIADRSTFNQSKLTKKQAYTNIGAALDDFFEMHVYGHLEKAEGTFGNTRVSKRKVANKMNQATTFAQMGLNLSQRVSNVATGSAQIMIEAIGSNYFGWKDLAYARKIYALESPKGLAQIGADEKDSKLVLFNDMFDVQQENKTSFYEHEFKGSVSKKLFSSNSLYALLKLGEHYLSTTTALALANRVRLKQTVMENGKQVEKDINLYDAYEVVYDNPETKSGARLKLKDGVKKVDGTAWTAEDELAFSNRSAGVNFKLQGIYNQNDKAPIQSRTLGSLLILYRKWLAPSIMRRYGSTTYNDLTGEWEEGYYKTTLNLVGNVLKDWEHFSTSVVVNWGKLNAYEKGNVRKAITEFGMLIGVYLAVALLHSLDIDDDDDNVAMLNWAQRMGLYQLLRLKNEIGTMTPTPMAVKEGLKILSSPAASLNTINRAINLANALMPWNWIGEQAEIKSGRYKGMTKTKKAFLEAPFISIWRNIDKFIDPDDMIQYFENDTMY